MENISTVAAISTPAAEGGISVIRISGDKALEIAEKVFVPVTGRRISEMSGYTACYGEICDGGKRLDDGVLLVYRAPHSYTGENVAEISCHGGLFISKRVLSACFEAGAEPAGAGEFTKRALLNGKLSLTQAEAVADIISAQNEQYLLCSRAQREGALYKRIRIAADKLLSLTTLIQAWIDYPDEMEDEFDGDLEADKLKAVENELCSLLSTYGSGRLLRDGIPAAIVGRPNVGKSTLMNLLSGCERSIVTDIEGTTRDIIEESVMAGDIMLRLSDCAGIRETNDVVEAVGVERMLSRLEESALVFAVFDGSRELSGDDTRLMELLRDKNTLCIVNKSDLPQKADIDLLREKFGDVTVLSAKDANSAEIIADKVREKSGLLALDPSAGFIANERQKKCAEEALSFVREAYSALINGVTLDAVGIMCENALDRLYELSGESANENIIDEVFRRFCVGK